MARIWEITHLTFDRRLGNGEMIQECWMAYIRARQAREEGDVFYRFYVPDTDPNIIWFRGDGET